MTDIGNHGDRAPQSEQAQLQEEITRALGERRLTPQEMRQLIDVIKNPDAQTELAFLDRLKTRHGLTAQEMNFLMEIIPAAINSPARGLKQSVAKGQTEGSIRKREGTAKLNSITNAEIRDAVLALEANEQEPTFIEVARYIGRQRGDPKLGTSFYQRLRYISEVPDTMRQQAAFKAAIQEVENARRNAATSETPPRGPSPALDGQTEEEADTSDNDSRTYTDKTQETADLTTTEPVVIEPREIVHSVRDIPPPAEKAGAAAFATAEPSDAASSKPVKGRTKWRVEKTPQLKMRAVADELQRLLDQMPAIKEHEWVKRFAPTAALDLEQQLIDWDNALVDLEDAAAKKTWDDKMETELRRIGANVDELANEIDSISGKMAT